MVPEEYAGKEYTCRSCGHTGVIPESSSEECVLVYHSGFPNEGMVLDRQDFWERLCGGQFVPNDLIFHEGAWHPLSMLYEMPPREIPQEELGPDIAIHLNELPPLPGFEKLGTHHPMRKVAEMLSNSLEWLKRSRSTRHKTAPQKAIYYGLVLAILALGYFCGLGQLLNYIRWRPAYVLVLNPDNVAYTAKLGRQSLTLPPNGKCTFQDIFVAHGSKQTLKLINQAGETCYSLKVPVYPALDVMVSPGEKLSFESYSLDRQKEVALNSRLLPELVEEITAGKAPATLITLERELRECAQQLHNGQVNGAIFTSEAYSFDHCGLSRSSEYTARVKDRSNSTATPKPHLAYAPVAMSISGQRLLYSPEERQTSCTITLDLRKPFLPISAPALKQSHAGTTLSPVTGRLVFELATDAQGKPRLKTTTTISGKATVNSNEFTGQWHYTPNPPRPDSKEWQWTWEYTGTHHPKNKKAKPQVLKITLQHLAPAPEKINVSVK